MGQSLEWRKLPLKSFENNNVEITITHCGICATDLHELIVTHVINVIGQMVIKSMVDLERNANGKFILTTAPEAFSKGIPVHL
ncbi:hypothetical protein INT45_010653 [Circinella minor]|uniref:Uncharacterized protein n=1 Tax=Circinella minor TaxID=1195481 RepID=A0A8H7S4W8_9FUNG|nr:hypothetical protein INT45_010653 [Circinella minor]